MGFLLLPSPIYLFFLSCVLSDLQSTSPAVISFLNSAVLNSDVFGVVIVAFGNGGPLGGLALIIYSAGRAYLDYRRRELAFRKTYTAPESK